MQELPEWKDRISQAVQRVLVNKDAYLAASKRTNGIAWGFFACTHWLEASCNPGCQILNGQSWKQVTTLEPKGRGPWDSWEDAALDGIAYQKVTPEETSTLQKLLRRLEQWNGFGYRNLGVDSPYLWSGTNHGVGVGKYVRDGVYDRNAVSAQVGCAPILARLIAMEEHDE